MGMIGNAPAAGVIASGNILDGSVDTVDLKDGAVTTAKLNDLNVTTAKIADGNVVNSKLGSDLDASKLTAGTLPIARIAANAIDNSKLASGVAAANLGFTPPNLGVPAGTASLSGNFSANTWYDLFNLGNFSSGTYILTYYCAFYNAGIGYYFVNGATPTFGVYGGGTNSTDVVSIPVYAFGHAKGGWEILIRTITSPNPGTAKLQWSINTAVSGLDGSSGKEGFFYLRRVV